MAKGYDKHIARQQQVAALGKPLSRRARSRCELCNERGSLKVVELSPLPSEPDVEWALLLCENCQPLSKPRPIISSINSLQFLWEMVWSEVPPVQILSVRLTRHLADQKVDWAHQILDDVILDPVIEARI